MVELYLVCGAIFAIFCYGYVLDKKLIENPINHDDGND
jgi:hypothetical protein